MASLSDFTLLLYQAMESPIGIEVEVDDFEKARQKIYTARRETGDEELKCLQFRVSPHGANLLWIVKGAQNAQG